MEAVTPADAIDYAIGLLVYCCGVVLIAAIPYVLGIVVAAGRTPGSSLFAFGVMQLATYTILLAGIAGLLYKVVANAVAAGRAAEADPDGAATEP